MRAQLDAVFQALLDGVFVFDLQGQLVHMNHSAFQLLGLDPGGKPPQDLEKFSQIFEVTTPEGQVVPVSDWPASRAIRGEWYSRLILNVRNVDTDETWVCSFSGNPAYDEKGQVSLAVVVIRNITDQMQVVRDLRHSQEQLNLVINAVPMLISYIDTDFRYRFVNRTYEEWMSRPLDQILNRPAVEILGEKAFSILKPKFERVLSGETVTFEEEIEYPDGTSKSIHASYCPDLDERGTVRGFVVAVTDMSSLKRVERRLATSEERFRKIAESLPQLVWTANADGVVDYYNDRISLYSGMKRELNDWRWEPMIHPEDVERTARIWKASVDEKAEFQCEHRILMKDGDYHWHLSRGTPLLDDKGEIRRWFGSATDIHDQKLVQSELKAAKEEAERANHLKSAFLANMSHEIRTPLGAILGFTDLMRDPDLSQTDRDQYARVVRRNGEQLSTVINDILDLSKVEAGHISLEFEETSPATVVADVATSMKVSADEKGLKLDFVSEASTPPLMVTDPNRLRQILMNVVGNAIKFTPAGSVRIRSYGRGKMAFFEVTDTGVGIPDSARNRIFDAFVQADFTLVRKFGGTGLGLSLSRELARSLGGDVAIAETIVGKGTRFLISIADQPEKLSGIRRVTATPIAPVERAKNALGGVRALVVDDSEDNRMLIGHFLSGYGADVDFAFNGVEGCRKALEGDFDVVLMDIQMPEMDGYTATSKLRESGYQKPIVALTAHAMSEVREKCLSVGCTDHLTKPIDIHALVGMIEKVSRPEATALYQQ